MTDWNWRNLNKNCTRKLVSTIIELEFVSLMYKNSEVDSLKGKTRNPFVLKESTNQAKEQGYEAKCVFSMTSEYMRFKCISEYRHKQHLTKYILAIPISTIMWCCISTPT